MITIICRCIKKLWYRVENLFSLNFAIFLSSPFLIAINIILNSVFAVDISLFPLQIGQLFEEMYAAKITITQDDERTYGKQ